MKAPYLDTFHTVKNYSLGREIFKITPIISEGESPNVEILKFSQCSLFRFKKIFELIYVYTIAFNF